MMAAWNAGRMEGYRRHLESKRDEWKDVAVIGNAGVGETSYINAIRSLTADDERGAAVDVTQATK